MRRLSWAFVASAALHGMLLWPAPTREPTSALSQPLAVTLRPPQVPPPATEAAAPAVTASPRLTSVGREREPRSRVLTVVRDGKLPSRPPALQAPVAPETSPPAQDLPQPSYDQAVAAADRATQPQASPTAPLATEGADGEALRQFRIAVARRVGQHDFPELADEIGAGNASVVRVIVGPAPGLANVSVARSSGHARLDAKARELIGAGVSATALPDALRGREFVADFRIEFRPRNDAPRD